MPTRDLLEKAVRLSRENGYLLIGTSDAEGLPHLATAGQIGLEPDKRMSITGWFCPGTLYNLDQNKKLSVVVWNTTEDIGYQILGEMEEMVETAMLNGFVPLIEIKKTVPQTENKVVFRVRSVLGFSRAPHSDLEV